MAENYGHCGSDCRSGQSGFHWGTGSALCTSIILEKEYGDLFINPSLKHALGINGIVVNTAGFVNNKIILSVDRIANDQYFGKILQIKNAKNVQLEINKSIIPIDKLGFFILTHDK